MIHLIRGRNSRVERANLIELSLDTRDFIQGLVGKEQWKMHTLAPGQQFAEILKPDDIIIRCGQDAVVGEKLLNNLRGYFNGVTMHTFDLQDAQDVRNIEKRLTEADDETDEGTGKDTAATRWHNQKFWVRADIAKACRRPKPQVFNPLNRLNASQALNELNYIAADTHMYFDIETRDKQCTCFSWSAGMFAPTFSFLVRNYSGVLQPDSAKVMAALAAALARSLVVVHNWMYDLPFLTFHHGFPLPRKAYCTMCSGRRLYPEADKSLAHYISLFTNFPNHKEMSINETHNSAQDTQLLEYNARDVQVLPFIHQEQIETAHRLSCASSLSAVNSCIPIYAAMGLRGLIVDEPELFIRRKMLERRMIQIQKLADTLCGPLKFELSSPAQAVNYFHNDLGYPPVELTPAGKPSLKGDLLYTLALGQPNPIISILIHYRELDKEHSMLGFKTPPEPINIP